MSGNNNTSDDLPEGFKEYAKLQLQQNTEIRDGLNTLTNKMAEMAKNMSEFMAVMAVSEERHNGHKVQMSRLEENQREQGKEFKDYVHNNDDRVMDVEKQVLALEKDTESISQKETLDNYTNTMR